ncbi:hypothetical protein QJ857_gp0113 [Tupanvirus soda lake]|uniref:Chorein N-terminal domain-containing protein n=2 Tax=Tupanvirus TaxID=2094720 RepID=A0A6N1NQ41_9VIRU|nr:hypothetical protein QJ857_gp0113 [Tupanvirus soda lake]QKU35910.1 hypothetical protein [Tupanvirus soda lake]
MAEWLKNICLSPFKFGLDKVNYVAVNAISVIFNLYGKRLLKIDDDKIIKSNECKNERDIFYFYPLSLKQIEQDVGLNLVVIESGIINDLSLSIPWKAMLTEPTLITIADIKLVTSFSHNTNSIYFNSLENTNSYFLSSKGKIKENQDLLNAYKEINALLSEYFNKITLEIKQIEIELLEHFKVIINGITFSNSVLTVNKMQIYSSGDEKLLISIDKLQFNTVEYHLSIGEINIDTKFVNHLPNFYTDDSKSKLKLKLNIDVLKMEKLFLKNLDLVLDSDNILVKNISHIDIDDILLFKNDNSSTNLLSFSTENNICKLEKPIDIKFSSINDVVKWVGQLKEIICIITNKIIVINLEEPKEKNPLQIKNIESNIIYGDDYFNLKLDNLLVDEYTNFLGVKIVHDGTTGTMDKILIGEKGVVFLVNSNVLSNDFHVFSVTTKIIKNDLGIDISFNQANAVNIIQFINFVTNIIDKFTTPKSEEPDNLITNEMNNLDLSASIVDLSETLEIVEKIEEKKPYMVNLVIEESNLLVRYEETNFNAIVKKANICITTKTATNVTADILMNDFLLAKIQSKHLSSNSIVLEKFQIFLDPETFDQLNYIFGTLTPEKQFEDEPEFEISEEGLRQLHEALTRSFMAKSVIDLEKSIKGSTQSIIETHKKEEQNIQIFNTPQIKMLTTSFANLRSVLIDDYYLEKEDPMGLELEIIIKSLHLYLFDKLVKCNSNDKNDPAFLCAIFKEIELQKIKEEVHEKKKEPLISVFEKGRKIKPNFRDKYNIYIKTGGIIDTQCHDPEWKYFAKFCKDNMFEASVIIHGDALRSSIYLSPITTNIREETLLRLLAFFSNSHHIPKNNNPLYVDYFSVSCIDIVVNFYPLILKQIGMGPNAFTLKDFKIRLSPQVITHVDGIDKVISIICNKWKDDVKPENIFQFIPNIKIIKPYAVPFVNFIQLTTKYFKHAHNKKKIRAITKNFNKGADMISAFVKYGVNQVWEYFN